MEAALTVGGAGDVLVSYHPVGVARAGGPAQTAREHVMRVLVLGAGFGGLELSTTLSEQLGDDVEVTLIDKADGFVFGFSKLDVMFGRRTAASVLHRYSDIVRPGVRFVQTVIRAIDPEARRVETDAGSFEGDVMVVALGR